jgi:hypothetical protein
VDAGFLGDRPDVLGEEIKFLVRSTVHKITVRFNYTGYYKPLTMIRSHV